MSYLAKPNIAIVALAVSTVTFAALHFVVDRELGVCVQLLAPGIDAVPL